jgi:hypothetical protein
MEDAQDKKYLHCRPKYKKNEAAIVKLEKFISEQQLIQNIRHLGTVFSIYACGS